MNIQEAKEQIRNAMTAYFSKDDLGNYEIPPQKQRPVFVMGPPGIGKTAIMEQIASEMGVCLLSYSMTHHTRQSALGLPFIVHREYEGEQVDVSEYTMSEIIAAIYEMRANTGIQEGILFLDEINCVSETLTPLMLQFLQYKVFGRHRMPDGWIVVTAGNPPEYNSSVREFDIATWDRLKRIDVEPDFEVWKQYAVKVQMHPSVTAYLESHREDFYKVETTLQGRNFVTARGWDDLAQMIRIYEKHNMPVDEKLISQYLQDPGVARNFAVYYDLFKKYRSDYRISDILAGKADTAVRSRASRASFDERISLVDMLYDALSREIRNVTAADNVIAGIMPFVKQLKACMLLPGSTVSGSLSEEIRKLEDENRIRKQAGAVSSGKQQEASMTLLMMKEMQAAADEQNDDKKAFAAVQGLIAAKAKQQKVEGAHVKEELDHALAFTAEAFRDDQEMLILITDLTENKDAVSFISRYGSSLYKKYSSELMISERNQDLEGRLAALDEALASENE